MVNITFKKFAKYFDELDAYLNELGSIHIKKSNSDTILAIVSVEMAEMYKKLETLYWIERAEDALEIDCTSTTHDNKLIVLTSVAKYIEEMPEQYRMHAYQVFQQIETEDLDLVVEELENNKTEETNCKYYKTLLFKHKIIYKKENDKYVICVIDKIDMKIICDYFMQKIYLL